MIEAAMVLFAIEAGVKLGTKVNEALINDTIGEALSLPLGEFAGNYMETEKSNYFLRAENSHLIEAGGPYEEIKDSPGKLTKAYDIIFHVHTQLGNYPYAKDMEEAGKLVAGSLKYRQFKKGDEPKYIKDIAGTLIEIGIDFFIANPQALGINSSARKYVEVFVGGLGEISFSEDTPQNIIKEIFIAGLQVFGDNSNLVTNDKRAEVIISGVTEAFIKEIKAIDANNIHALIKREAFIKTIGASLLRGAADAIADDPGLFINENKKMLSSVLTQLMEGIRDSENLFTSEALELLIKKSLGAVSENADLITDDKLLQDFIKGTLTVIISTEGKELFSEAVAAKIVAEALTALSENMGTIISPDGPEEQLLANALAAMAKGLASDLADGNAKDLLSTNQLLELTKIVFAEVAKNPEHLVAGVTDDVGKTVLAQILGSIATAIGNDPKNFVTGDTLIELIKTAVEVTVHNMDGLLKLDTDDPKTNLLYKVIKELTDAVLEIDDHRKLMTKDTFLELAQRILPIVSSNLDKLPSTDTQFVKEVISALFTLAEGDLKNRINGSNLPILVEKILQQVLSDQLDITDEAVVKDAVVSVLNNAA